MHSGESATISKIVQEILSAIQHSSLENDLIDIDSRVDELNKLLDMEAAHEVCMVGICGMGGIGKTTIARALFKRITYTFEGSSFARDVKENSFSRRDICALQEQILQDILMTSHDFKIRNPEDGAEMIKTLICNKKVLLVLDDVDNNKQLDFLAARHEWFGPGSRIIITTRDEHLLSDANVKYKPALLRIGQAVELFSMHAFRKNSPPEGYEELSYRAVSYTGYLPLALKVLGSFLRGRKVVMWESALNRLTKTPNKEIFEALVLSFNGLEDSEKQIFLDIACIFKGRKLTDVTRVLESFDFNADIGISVLIEKSLMTVSFGKLCMHDLIQEMGWQIVRQNFPNSRLWQLNEIHDIITKKEQQSKIEAILAGDPPNYNYQYDEKLGFSADVFESMKNLRLLDTGGKFTSSAPTILPDELRWLCWNKYPFSSLPILHMHKLVGLEMFQSRIEHLWIGQKIMQNLKFVHLESLVLLTRFPDVSGAPNIERFILSKCDNLVEVHESIGFLRKIIYLDMRYCKQLTYLPSRFEMESLETLILISCSSLESLPEFSPHMVKLSHIYLEGCEKLIELPSSITLLSQLSLLSLEACLSLKTIPNSIHELENLKTLWLHDCRELKQLPNKFGSMEKLEELELGFFNYFSPSQGLVESINFHALKNLCSLGKLDLTLRQIRDADFPENFHGLSSLEELRLRGNTKLIHLPACISHLSCLKQLDVSSCWYLQDLHGLPSGIQVLNASDCKSLKKIEDLTKEYNWLYKIWLLDCNKLIKDEQNRRYLDILLKQSFIQKWVAVDRCLSIAIPGSKIPNWFEEQQHGNKIAMKLPLNWQTQIVGFAICGVFKLREIQLEFPLIHFRFEIDGMFAPKSEADCINESAASDDGNLCLGYIPFTCFKQMHGVDEFQSEEWSHVNEGNLVMTLGVKDYEPVRCGAHIVYQGDVEPIQPIQPSVYTYWNWKLTRRTHNTIQFYDAPILSFLKV